MRYEVRLSQIAPAFKDVSTAIVSTADVGSVSKTFGSLTPGRYRVSVYCEFNWCRPGRMWPGVWMNACGWVPDCQFSEWGADPPFSPAVVTRACTAAESLLPGLLPHAAAINANGDFSSSATTSSPVIVGAPLPPTVVAVQAGVGQLTVQWTAPVINAVVGTTYTLAIYDVTADRSPPTAALEDIAMSSTTHSVTNLVAGTKRVRITATNVNSGAGKYTAAVQSALSDAADVGLSTAPGIASPNGVVGSADGATISVTAPVQMSTAALNKFLIQVGAQAG